MAVSKVTDIGFFSPRTKSDLRKDIDWLELKYSFADGDVVDNSGGSDPVNGNNNNAGLPGSESLTMAQGAYSEGQIDGMAAICSAQGLSCLAGFSNPSTALASGDSYSGAYSAQSAPYITGANSGVYAGSLSSLGNMVAMSLSDGDYQLKITQAGWANNRYYDVGATILASEWGNLSPAGGSPPLGAVTPYISGYIRTYWKDPAGTTFGSNSAIPALTGVIPDNLTNAIGEPITDLRGNFVAYVDLQMQRLSGSNTWNTSYFLNVFGQVQSWVLTSNSFLAATLNAEANTLANYGAQNYSDFVTQGFNKYKIGIALRKALGNLGLLISTIPDGYFGTPNAVAKLLIDSGLGYIEDFSANLLLSGVVYTDIYNPNYTSTISILLKSITNADDLDIIQQTLKTTMPTMTSPLDYTNIVLASGLTNDSAFTSLEEFGKDIFYRAANLQVIEGVELVELINNVVDQVSANVNALSGNTTINGSPPLLSQDIIDNLRTYLPLAEGNGPVSMIDVIGTGAGYLLDGIKAVNAGIAQLYATEYGPMIRDTLTEISRYISRYSLSEAETRAAQTFVPVPPASYTVNSSNKIVSTGGPDYWQTKLEEKKREYLDLLATIAADQSGEIQAIVTQINNNWTWCCRKLYFEWRNYNRANLTVSAFSDTSTYLAFASALPDLGADTQNIGTDYMLYQMAQPNQAGDTMKSLLGQGKTSYLLGQSGVADKNVI